MRPNLLLFSFASFAALGLSACDKGAPSPTAKPDPAPSATPPAPAPTPTPDPSPAPAVTVAVGDGGKGKEGGTALALRPATKHVEGKNFKLELASPGCKAAEECALTIKLSAGSGYHVNKEYPYKFLATPAPSVTFLGKGDPNTFTRAAGDFVERGEQLGVMTVRFRPSAPGETKVGGRYKLSVCSADQCQIEEENVELAVPVM